MNAACGMTSAKPWSGNTDVDGGFLIVKRTGRLSASTFSFWTTTELSMKT